MKPSMRRVALQGPKTTCFHGKPVDSTLDPPHAPACPTCVEFFTKKPMVQPEVSDTERPSAPSDVPKVHRVTVPESECMRVVQGMMGYLVIRWSPGKAPQTIGDPYKDKAEAINKALELSEQFGISYHE